MDIFDVDFSLKVKKTLIGLPIHIIDKLEGWVKAIEKDGLRQVQKTPGYHDEPLKGKRFGQRSIRLNKHIELFIQLKKEKKSNLLKLKR